MKLSFRKILSLFALINLFIGVSFAQEICPLNGLPLKPKMVSSLKEFKQIAILDNGRIKPLDTYAQNLLLRFSGKRTFQKQEATHWLAKLLLAPQATIDDKIFLINNPEIPTALGIKVNQGRRYSYRELSPVFNKVSDLAQKANEIQPKERDVVESELIRLFDNIKLFSQLSMNFSFAMPHPDFTINHSQNIYNLKLSLNIPQYSFMDLAVKADVLQDLTKTIQIQDPDAWSQEDRELVGLVNNLYQWNMNYHNLTFNIIAPFDLHDEVWLSPWDSMALSLQDRIGRQELINLTMMLAAYWNGKQLEFDLACRGFNDSINKRSVNYPGIGLKFINIELFSNKAQLLFWAKILYLLTFFLFLFSLIKDSRFNYQLTLVLSGIAISMHTLAIVLRCIILQRPPVSNLYETFIFVGIVCAFVGILIERVNKQWMGLVIVSLSGYVFLTIAGRFSSDGDTLQMLVAVLNSNFWLSTHVISITIGYAGACVAGVVGHIYLFQAIFKTNDQKLLNSTYKVLLGTLGFGLTMTFLGTNLGGIWADQSWGRFWGWDPKENGALLIVLWIAILFHLKIARVISEVGLAIGSALGLIVVMWAWFGVNLLSIGLHSYGFTSGLAYNLAIYFVVQILSLCVLGTLASKKLKKLKK